MRLTSHAWTEGSDRWMLASPADGAWAGYCDLRTSQTKWNELRGTGHELVPSTLLERPVITRKYGFLVLPLHKTRTFDYFFYWVCSGKVTLLFWLLRGFKEKFKIRSPAPQSHNAIRHINDNLNLKQNRPHGFSSHFKEEALGTRLNLFFRYLTWVCSPAIHVVQNRHAGEQNSHWDKTNKGNYHLKLCLSFVCLVPVRLLLSSSAVLYQVNG